MMSRYLEDFNKKQTVIHDMLLKIKEMAGLKNNEISL